MLDRSLLQYDKFISAMTMHLYLSSELHPLNARFQSTDKSSLIFKDDPDSSRNTKNSVPDSKSGFLLSGISIEVDTLVMTYPKRNIRTSIERLKIIFFFLNFTLKATWLNWSLANGIYLICVDEHSTCQ